MARLTGVGGRDSRRQAYTDVFTAPCQASHRTATKTTDCKSYFVHIPKAVNVLPGRCMNPSRLDDYLQTFCDNLRLAADTFAPFGVNTVFEAINTIDIPGFIPFALQISAVPEEAPGCSVNFCSCKIDIHAIHGACKGFTSMELA